MIIPTKYNNNSIRINDNILGYYINSIKLVLYSSFFLDVLVFTFDS